MRSFFQGKGKAVLRIVLGGGVFLLVLEIALRWIWGFGNMPLYYSDSRYEYAPCPNQKMTRLGNEIYYNSYSQRSDEPDTTKTIVLGLGDSVLNGGVQTPQDSLATTMFSRIKGFQMLNVSVGSWGPDNIAAYLKAKGTFRAKALFVLLSSHDAHDLMDFRPIVGEYPSYPDRQYLCAIVEVICRYAWPRLMSHFKNERPDPDQQVVNQIHGIRKGYGALNPGFNQLKRIADSINVPFILCLHAESSECRIGRYNEQGQEIINWAKKNKVYIIEDIHMMDRDCYRDEIHINAKGQRRLFQIMKQTLLPLFD